MPTRVVCVTVGAIVVRGQRLLHVCISPTQLQVVLACFQHFRHICARLDTTPFLTSILKKVSVVRRGGISATIEFGWMHSSLIRAKRCQCYLRIWQRPRCRRAAVNDLVVDDEYLSSTYICHPAAELVERNPGQLGLCLCSLSRPEYRSTGACGCFLAAWE